MANKFSFIKQRITHIADFKGISYKDFCEKIGMTTANFRGEAQKTPINSDVIAKILSLFDDISPEWLISGKGEMLKSKNLKTSQTLAEPETFNYLIQTNKNLSESNRQLSETNAQLVKKIQEDVGTASADGVLVTEGRPQKNQKH